MKGKTKGDFFRSNKAFPVQYWKKYCELWDQYDDLKDDEKNSTQSTKHFIKCARIQIFNSLDDKLCLHEQYVFEFYVSDFGIFACSKGIVD